MSADKEIQTFLESWEVDPLGAKPAFEKFHDYLASLPRTEISFKARPGISYSMRAQNASQKSRDLFVLVDVVDDEPENRWLSVCFYADMVTDPDELGDFVPAGLMGEDAACFNLDENDLKMREYIGERIREAATRAAE